MDEQDSPPAEAVQLSDHDRAMLERHVEDLAAREKESRESMTKPAEEKQWTVERPENVHHSRYQPSPREYAKGQIDTGVGGSQRMSRSAESQAIRREDKRSSAKRPPIRPSSGERIPAPA